MPSTLSRERLASFSDAARGKRVVIVGDAMLDVYLRGDVDRISPEAPVPVVRVRERRDALGGAANVAQNVAALGAVPRLVAAVGRDAAGARLRAMLRPDRRRNATAWSRSTAPRRPRRASSRACSRSCASMKKRTRTCADGGRRAGARARRARLDDADALVLEDYNKGVLFPPVIARAIDGRAARRLPVVVDPKYRNFFAYTGATIFKPNRRELEAALGAAVDLEHPETLPATLARLGSSTCC